jgi:hypothetical protein
LLDALYLFDSEAAPQKHETMFRSHIIGYSKGAFLSIVTIAALLLGAQAQQNDVTFVQLSKDLKFRQTGATRVSLIRPAELPYAFNADVECASRAAALRVKPTLTLPANSRFRSIYNLIPSLGLSDPDTSNWRFGFKGNNPPSNFDNWGTKTKTELDQSFPAGGYVFKLQGRTINLNLPEDAYPPSPAIKLSGGKWSGGAYYINPATELVISTGLYKTYGNDVNNYIYLDVEEDTTGDELLDHVQVAKKMPNGPRVSSSKSYKHRIPANTLQLGKKYIVSCGYGAITTQSALDKAPVLVSFGSDTEVTIIAKASP